MIKIKTQNVKFYESFEVITFQTCDKILLQKAEFLKGRKVKISKSQKTYNAVNKAQVASCSLRSTRTLFLVIFSHLNNNWAI